MNTTNNRDLSNSDSVRQDGPEFWNVSYFRIYGLNCQRCAGRVKTALLQAPGVKNVIVEFPDSLAEVTYDPKQVTMDALHLAVLAAGDGGHHRYLAEWIE